MISAASLIRSKFVLPLEILGLVALPVVLLRLSATLLFFRHAVMAILLVYVFWMIRRLKLPIRFKKPQPLPILLKSSILPSLVLSFLLAPLVLKFPQLVYIDEIAQQNTHFPTYFPPLFYAIVYVPLQEFIFRAFYIERLRVVIKSEVLVIVISSFVFGFAHFVFKNPYFPFLTGILGLWWGYLYIKNNCFWPAVISHATLGSVALYLAIHSQ